MSRPRAVLIVNPAADTHKAARLTQGVLARLSEHVDATAVAGVDAAGSRRLVAEHRDSVDAVITLGGDGIVHLAVQELAGGDVPLGIIPAGTGNDSAATVGMATDPLTAATELGRAMVAGSTRSIDLGRAEGGDGPPRWWVTVLAAGFDSGVNERANNMRWPRGPRRYDIGIALEALTLRPRHYRLELDGIASEFDATMVSVANGPQYGGGKLVAPDARIDDGHFTVCVIAPINRRLLARLAPKLDVGQHVGHPAVSFHTATQVRIEADRLAWADGERIGPLPVTSVCVPAAQCSCPLATAADHRPLLSKTCPPRRSGTPVPRNARKIDRPFPA